MVLIDGGQWTNHGTQKLIYRVWYHLTGSLWYSNHGLSCLVPFEKWESERSVVLKLEFIKLSTTPDGIQWYSNCGLTCLVPSKMVVM